MRKQLNLQMVGLASQKFKSSLTKEALAAARFTFFTEQLIIGGAESWKWYLGQKKEKNDAYKSKNEASKSKNDTNTTNTNTNTTNTSAKNDIRQMLR